MVTLTITPKSGNHTRYFPHSGYLGLSPVVVSGTVRTQLEEDLRPIEASKVIIRIRCYEAIGSSQSIGLRPDHHHPHPQHPANSNPPKHHSSKSSHLKPSSRSQPSSSAPPQQHPPPNHSVKPPSSSSLINKFSNVNLVNVLWQTEQTLWSASSSSSTDQHNQDDPHPHPHPHPQHQHHHHHQYRPLGDWQANWKLTIPTNAIEINNHQPSSHPQNSNDIRQFGRAVGSITYKSWRTWWQVESVIYHKPAGLLGTKIIKSHALHLINYGEAEKYYSRAEETTTTIQSTATTNRRIRYSITSPTSACCGDEVTLKILIGTGTTNSLTNTNHHTPPNHHHHLPPFTPTITTNGSPHHHQSNEPEIILKRLQVSLVRSLAIEVYKANPPTSSKSSLLSSSSSSPSFDRLVDHRHRPWRLGRRLTSPHSRILTKPFPSSSSSPIITTQDSADHLLEPSHCSSSGSSSNSTNSKRQLTTFNTLITNTEGISKSILSDHHHQTKDQQIQPIHDLVPQQPQFDYIFVVKLKIPLAKSRSHYSIGETCTTGSATVNFSFQFKLSIKNKLTNRIETIELSELNLQVFSISKQEIKVALDHLKKFAFMNHRHLQQNRDPDSRTVIGYVNPSESILTNQSTHEIDTDQEQMISDVTTRSTSTVHQPNHLISSNNSHSSTMIDTSTNPPPYSSSNYVSKSSINVTNTPPNHSHLSNPNEQIGLNLNHHNLDLGLNPKLF